MEKKLIFEKLDKKTFEKILQYIKDANFKFKLFTYSKQFQKKFGIELSDYASKFLKKEFNDFKVYLQTQPSKSFKLDNLKKKLKEDSIKLNIDEELYIKVIIKKISECCDKIIKENNYDNVLTGFVSPEYNFKIDVYSPIFELLSKEKFFELFCINVDTDLIKSFKLKNFYITTFDKLNKNDSKYAEIFFSFIQPEDINYIKELKIDFNKIKRLTLFAIQKNFQFNYKIGQAKSNWKNYNYLTKNLFSLPGIQNNLTYLKIDSIERTETSFEGINTLQSLLILHMIHFKAKDILKLNIPQLKKIILEDCENIEFAEDSLLNLEDFSVYESIIIKPKNLLKCPNLKNYEYFLKFIPAKYYNIILDFSSCEKLQKMKGDYLDFLKLEKSNLEDIYLLSKKDISIENEISMVDKILSIKTLKSVKIQLRHNIFNTEPQKVTGENDSVVEAEIDWNYKNECIISNLLNKFPNLKKIYIESNNLYGGAGLMKGGSYQTEKISLNIEEDEDSQINDICLKMNGTKKIELICGPFEDLEKFDIDIEEEIIDLENSCKIFNNDNSDLMFYSLKYFSFVNKNFNFTVINNICNNLDNMPNLKEFFLRANNVKDFNEDIYQKFIDKLLNMNLDALRVKINDKTEVTKFKSGRGPNKGCNIF